MTRSRSADSVHVASGIVPVFETKPGSIIVPGLSGMAEIIPVFINHLLTPYQMHTLIFLSTDGRCNLCSTVRIPWEVCPCPCMFSCVTCPTERPKFPEIISRIKTYLRSHPEVANDPAAFIQGMGWDQNRWESKEFPTAVGSQFTT